MRWDAALRRAAVQFAIPPAAFWRLSLKEWRALVGEDGPRPLTRAEFEAMMAADDHEPVLKRSSD